VEWLEGRAHILYLHSSTALSNPSCSFWAMAYIITSKFIAVRMLRLGRRFLERSYCARRGTTSVWKRMAKGVWCLRARGAR